MFNDELDLIRAAEKRGDNLILKAEEDAKNLVDDSGRKASLVVEDGKVRAREIITGYKEEGRRIAEDNYRERIKEAESEAVQVEKRAAAAKDKAIDIISERIVKSSVNS